MRGQNTVTFVVESGTEVEAGDILVQLDTLAIEEEISNRTKFFHLAESQVARSGADVERAKLAISEYSEGRFVSELSALQKNLAVAESRLLNARNRLKHSQMLSRSEYASELELEEREFALSQAELTVKLTQTQIDVLKNFTKKEELIRLEGELHRLLRGYEEWSVLHRKLEASKTFFKDKALPVLPSWIRLKALFTNKMNQ